VNVLILHNRYRQPGGEERSVAQIEALLRQRGHRVEILERTSEGLSRGRAGSGMLRGGSDPAEVARAVSGLGAEVVHAHNIHPLFGARALVAAKGAGARVVMHLHNYRLICAKAIAQLDGKPCTRCQARSTTPAVRHRCRDSIWESIVYAAGIARQQRSLLGAVDRFLVPSGGAIERLRSLGAPTDRMAVLHNALPGSAFVKASRAGDGRHALCTGRLVQEKGIDLAIAACARLRVPLVVAGRGPAEPRLRRLASDLGADVRFVGQVGREELGNLRRRAALTLFPSRWDEPGPFAVIESMAAGVPVLASNLGGLPEIVGEEGVLPADAIDAWAQALSSLWSKPERRQQQGEAVLARARQQFNVDRFYRGLMDAYRAPL
jgi:glycosyltransferase involved in cell wall biosynthesis